MDIRVVDLRSCKVEAALILPPGHPLRELLLREPDFLPLAEGLGKLETYVRLAVILRGAG